MPRPIRIITPHYDDDDYDPMEPPSGSFLKPTPAPPRNLPREPRPSRPVKLRAHNRTQSQSAEPIYGIPGPASTARGAAEVESPVASPPFRDGPSPITEPGLMPGGGIEIPPGFRFTAVDQGRYRTRARDMEEGEIEEPRVLGGMGFGMFKGLKKIPAAIVKAGRSYGPRNQHRQDIPAFSESPEQIPREVPDDVHDEVETYEEHEEEEEPPAHEEELLREYIQRRRMRRDRAYRERSGRERERNYVPAPQPVPLPGSRAASAAASQVGHSQNGHSQTGHSQAGHSDIPPPNLEAAIEAEEMAQEREDLVRAQERERARREYAAGAVKLPSSSVSSPPFMGHSSTSHRHTASEPGLSNRVFSRWAAERDAEGQRIPNRPDRAAGTSSSSPLSMSNMRRIIQQIRDMPWVGDRVAADYVPGGVKPPPSARSARYYAGSDSTFTSLDFRGAVNGLRLPMSDVSGPSVARGVANNPGESWYATRENMLVLPVGVAPPPGFIPYPGPYPPPPPHQQQQYRDQGSIDGDGPPSASSHTHVEGSEAPPMPIPAPAPVPAPTGPGPAYMSGGAYHYMPAEASETGQPYVFVPTPNGRHRTRRVPRSQTGSQMGPAFPGQPNFIPMTQ